MTKINKNIDKNSGKIEKIDKIGLNFYFLKNQEFVGKIVLELIISDPENPYVKVIAPYKNLIFQNSIVSSKWPNKYWINFVKL